MKEVWIVFGSTGEYSDFTEWWVCACLTEERAREIADELNKWCREKGLHNRGADWVWDEPKPDLDPNFKAYYTGTSYSYAKCEIK